MATHRLTITGWHPTKINTLLTTHWAKRGRYRKSDDLIVALTAREQKIPKAAGRRRVSLTIVLAPKQRGGDPDGYLKSALDALVACGLIQDDRRQCLDLGTINYERGKRKATIITLEDL